MRFLVAYIVSFMSSLFLTLYVGNDLIQYGYSTYGHVAFLILFSFLSGAFLFLGIDKYEEVSEEASDAWDISAQWIEEDKKKNPQKYKEVLSE